MTSPASVTGTIPFKVPGLNKQCVTWYKVFGDLNSDKRPLIALHGGPGVGYVQATNAESCHHFNPKPYLFHISQIRSHNIKFPKSSILFL